MGPLVLVLALVVESQLPVEFNIGSSLTGLVVALFVLGRLARESDWGRSWVRDLRESARA